MLAEVRAQQGNLDEAERLYRRAGQLGAMRAHTAYGGFLQLARDDWAGAEREFREAERRAEPGWATALAGSCSTTDGRRGPRLPALAADDGDAAAAEALIDLDGDPTDD